MSVGADRPDPAEAGLSRHALLGGLRELGVGVGQTLLVGASLRSLGWVAGGAATVVGALREIVGLTGNIVIPTGTEENSNTSRAHLARIAGMRPEQVAGYRNRMPAFDRQGSVSTAGRIAEEVRTSPGAVRSGHPQSSFAALGPLAGELMADHPLTCHLGMRSPLGKLYELDRAGALSVRILLIGVGYRACTALHLAEYRYREFPPTRTYSCVIMAGRRRRWTVYRDVVLDDGDFERVGGCLDKEIVAYQGYVGYAECRLMSLGDAVDRAAIWMQENRI